MPFSLALLLSPLAPPLPHIRLTANATCDFLLVVSVRFCVCVGGGGMSHLSCLCLCLWACARAEQESRLVMLPLESHSYQARESVLHMCAEIDEWLIKHLGADGEVES